MSLTMNFKLCASFLLLGGLAMCGAHTTTASPSVSRTSSTGSQSTPFSDTAPTSPSGAQSAPTSSLPSSSSSTSAVSPGSSPRTLAVNTPESPSGHNHTVLGDGDGAEVSTPDARNAQDVPSPGSGDERTSVQEQPASFTTPRSETGIAASPAYTTKGTFLQDTVSLQRSRTIGVTPSTAVLEESVSAPTVHSQQLLPQQGTDSDSSSAVSASDAEVVSVRMTSPEGGASSTSSTHGWQTPCFHTSVSGSAARLASGVFSVSASAGDEVLVTSLQPSSQPGWKAADSTSSWPVKSEMESSDFTSDISEMLPETTRYTIDLSVASEAESFQRVTSQTAATVLDPSSVIHFTSSEEEMTLTRSHSIQTTANTPAVSDSSESLASSFSATALQSSALDEAPQTYDRLAPSQTLLSVSSTTPVPPSTLLPGNASDTQKSSLETWMISASSVLPSATVTEQVPVPSSPTEVTPTHAYNTTTTTSTTVVTTTTLPARRDIRYLFILNGDCHLILNNTEFFQRFLAGFHDLVVKQLGIVEDTYRLGEISCGTVHVYVTFLHVTMPDFDIRLQSIIRNGGPGLSIPVWIDSHFATFDLVHAKHVPLAPDEHTYNIVAEVMDDVDIIVIIVACCICGVLIAIGIAICVKECYRRKHASTFDLLDVPHVNLKLEDFSLTRIPRPRAIYKEPSSVKGSRPGEGFDSCAVYTDLATEPTSNGHSKNVSNGTLHPSDLHLRIREHSDGIIVGVTAALSSSHAGYYHPAQSVPEGQTEGGVSRGTTKRSKPRIRTPDAEDVSEGESLASERLLAAHAQGETEGTPNPMFVDDPEEEERSRREVGGAL